MASVSMYCALPCLNRVAEEGLVETDIWHFTPEAAVQAMLRTRARKVGFQLSDCEPKSAKSTRAQSAYAAEELLTARKLGLLKMELNYQEAFEQGHIEITARGVSLVSMLQLDRAPLRLGSMSVKLTAQENYLMAQREEEAGEVAEAAGLAFKFVGVSSLGGAIIRRNWTISKVKYPTDWPMCVSDVEKAALLEWVASEGKE
ncbi:unnamed protein product, partial [Effrenium voratum]